MLVEEDCIRSSSTNRASVEDHKHRREWTSAAFETSTNGDCAFPIAAAKVWNILPGDVTASQSLIGFAWPAQISFISNHFPWRFLTQSKLLGISANAVLTLTLTLHRFSQARVKVVWGPCAQELLGASLFSPPLPSPPLNEGGPGVPPGNVLNSTLL